MRDECDHGSLRRSCQICDRDQDIADMRKRIAELEAENENLRTVMVAAAEEIKLHWEAHCDPVEGLGPVNLLRRLECGIPAEYGYKAGNFRRLMYRVKALEAGYENVRSSLYAEAYGRADHADWSGTDPLESARLEGVNGGIGLAVSILESVMDGLSLMPRRMLDDRT